MSDKKRKRVYEALIEGANKGLSDKDLFSFVLEKCPQTTSKRLVRASLLALSDPDISDPNVLHAVYALAIKHRLDQGPEESQEEIKELSNELRKSKKTRNEKAAHAANGAST
jgi:hypothetical protein